MAYSNQTANYGLPQYVGSDLATWQDNTEAWAKVDAGMQANKTAAASASTAAGQAQATASAAQSQAGAVGGQVNTLLDRLEVHGATLNYPASIQDKARLLSYNKIMCVLKANISSNQKSSIQAFTETDSTYWIELFTSPTNVYQLETSAVSGDKFYLGSCVAEFNNGGTKTNYYINPSCFWDGTTTRIGLSITKTFWDGLNNTAVFTTGFCLVSLFTGDIVPAGASM